MDTLEIEFQRLLRARSFERATNALENWSTKSAIGEARSSFWKACLLYEQGQFSAAIDELTQTIAAGRDMNRLCLGRRARMFLDHDDLRKALTDYLTILTDQSERIVEAFHPSAAFRSAYISARLGDPEFESAVRKVNPEYSEWVVDKILNVSDLLVIYSKTRTHRRASN